MVRTLRKLRGCYRTENTAGEERNVQSPSNHTKLYDTALLKRTLWRCYYKPCTSIVPSTVNLIDEKLGRKRITLLKNATHAFKSRHVSWSDWHKILFAWEVPRSVLYHVFVSPENIGAAFCLTFLLYQSNFTKRILSSKHRYRGFASRLRQILCSNIVNQWLLHLSHMRSIWTEA